MRLNGNGTLSIGNTNSTFPLEVTGTIRSTSSRPNTILDTSNTAGTAGQLLSSTGSAIQWINAPTPVTPAGSTGYVQYNDGGVFGANASFLYDAGLNILYAPSIDVSSDINASTVNTSVINPTNILDGLSSFGTSGQLLSSTGSAIQWVNPPTATAAGSNFQVQYNSSGSLAADSVFTYNSASQFLLVPNVQCSGRITPTLIQDNGSGSGGLPSTGTSGQYLSATGSGIVWTNRPVPYADSRSGVGAFITTAPTSATSPTVSFGLLPRTSRYQLTANVVTFPTASNVTVTVEIWTRQVSGGAYSLSLTTTTFMNSINVHLAFPSKSAYLNLTGGNILDVVVRTGANTSSNSSDPVNIDLLECTI